MIDVSQRLKLAQRIVDGLDAQPGELIQVRGDPGSYDFLLEVLLAIEDDRCLPFLVVAVPGTDWAQTLGMPLPELEAALLPALLASPEELQVEIDRLLDAVGDSQELKSWLFSHSGEPGRVSHPGIDRNIQPIPAAADWVGCSGR